MSDCADVLRQILREQRETNRLLILLIDALAECGDDGIQQPVTYLSGKPVV